MFTSTGLTRDIAALGALSRDSMVRAWLAVNVLDSLITCLALRMGASEISFSYRLTGDMLATTVLKYSAVFLVIGILWQVRRVRWLSWLVVGMLFVLAWNLTQIICHLWDMAT